MRKNQVMSTLVVGIVAGLLVLTYADFAQAQEKTQKVKASLTVLSVGGCEERGEGASISDGAFCCSRDRSKLQKALNGVKGVLKVAMKKDSREVTIDYGPGPLYLTAVIKAADRAGFDVILQHGEEEK